MLLWCGETVSLHNLSAPPVAPGLHHSGSASRHSKTHLFLLQHTSPAFTEHTEQQSAVTTKQEARERKKMEECLVGMKIADYLCISSAHQIRAVTNVPFKPGVAAATSPYHSQETLLCVQLHRGASGGEDWTGGISFPAMSLRLSLCSRPSAFAV